MDLNSIQLCHVCLQNSEDSVNIFKKFQNLTIAAVVAKHFSFQVNKNDGITEWLCQICWIHIKTFHIFYKRIELLRENYCSSTDLELLECDLNVVKCEETKLTEVVYVPISKENCSEYYNEGDGNYNKVSNDCDESKNSPTAEDQSSNEKQKDDYVGGIQTSKNCSDLDDDANDCDESKNSQILANTDQSSNKKPKNDHIGDINVTGKQTPTANIKPIPYNSYSRTELNRQNAQIREFFSMKCEICNDVEFETLLSARQHYRRVHKTKGYIVCCKKKFRERREILNHILRHVNPDAHRCDQCGKCFARRKTLKIHMDYHLPLESRAHKCSLCPKSFTKGGYLNAHMKDRHSGEPYTCEKCNKTFSSRLSLRSHIQGIHGSSAEHICEICAFVCKRKSTLRSHVANMHPSTPVPKVQCNVCGAWFVNKGLSTHMKRAHNRNKEDLVNCPICKKVVKGKYPLKAHIRHVHGERNHQCVLCVKTFKSAKLLKEHIACHTGENLYDCMFCEKKFKSSANLCSHRKKTHLAEWTQYLEKKRRQGKSIS